VGVAKNLQAEVAAYETLRTTGNFVEGADIEAGNTLLTLHGQRGNIHLAE